MQLVSFCNALEEAAGFEGALSSRAPSGVCFRGPVPGRPDDDPNSRDLTTHMLKNPNPKPKSSTAILLEP